MEQELQLGSKFLELNKNELSEINGGIVIIIAGVAFVGWQAVALIAAGVTTLAGAAALGFYNGFWDTRK